MPPPEIERGRGWSGVKPRGRLKRIFRRFNAPDDVLNCAARRIGGVVGNNGIPHEVIEQTVITSIEEDGIPHWGKVLEKLGEAASRVYKGKSPFKSSK